MSTKITLDADEMAFEVHQLIEGAKVYLMVPEATSVNHAVGLAQAIKAHTICELFRANLDPRHVEQRDRFVDLAKESRQVIESYWKIFKVTAIVRTNGSSMIIGGEVEKTKPVEGRQKKPYMSRVWLPKDKIKEIKTLIGGRSALPLEEMEEIGAAYGISPSTVRDIVKGRTHKDV